MRQTAASQILSGLVSDSSRTRKAILATTGLAGRADLVCHAQRLLGLAIQLARRIVVEWRQAVIEQDRKARLAAQEVETEKLLLQEATRQREYVSWHLFCLCLVP